MNGQINLFDLLAQSTDPRPGDYVEISGRELSFDECVSRVGQIVIFDRSTESHKWYQAMRIEKLVQTEDGRRLICYDGCKQRALIGELYFNREVTRYPEIAYEI